MTQRFEIQGFPTLDRDYLFSHLLHPYAQGKSLTVHFKLSAFQQKHGLYICSSLTLVWPTLGVIMWSKKNLEQFIHYTQQNKQLVCVDIQSKLLPM